MEAINRFVDFRKGDAFGLTFFGNSVLHWVPLTSDVSAIKCATPFMRPERNIPGFGGTEIGKALLACRKVLADRQEAGFGSADATALGSRARAASIWRTGGRGLHQPVFVHRHQ